MKTEDLFRYLLIGSLIALFGILAINEATAQRVVVINKVKPIVLPPTVLPYQYKVGEQYSRGLSEKDLDRLATLIAARIKGEDPPAVEEEPELAPVEELPDLDRVKHVINQRCVNCHNPDNTKGGIDLADVDAIDSETSRLVTAQIFDGTMPKGGEPLTDEEVAVFIRWHLRKE